MCPTFVVCRSHICALCSEVPTTLLQFSVPPAAAWVHPSRRPGIPCLLTFFVCCLLSVFLLPSVFYPARLDLVDFLLPRCFAWPASLAPSVFLCSSPLFLLPFHHLLLWRFLWLGELRPWQYSGPQQGELRAPRGAQYGTSFGVFLVTGIPKKVKMRGFW